MAAMTSSANTPINVIDCNLFIVNYTLVFSYIATSLCNFRSFVCSLRASSRAWAQGLGEG